VPRTRLRAASLVLLVLVIAVATLASATARQDTPLMVSFADLTWTELPQRKGMQYALLTGNPKTGTYTQLRKVPAGSTNPLHAHSSKLTNVLISGVWYTGPDDASARDFGPGSVILMPAGWNHVSGCRPGAECVFYQDGKGSFDFKPAAPGGK
jgi:hypothetical protein